MPTTNEARGLRPDPVLSTIAISHAEPGLVGHDLAPIVPVVDSKGQFPVFDRLRRPPQTLRAPRARANETDFAVAKRPFDLESHMLNFVYEDREKREYEKMNNVIGAAELFNMERDGILHTEGQLQFGREANIAARLRANPIPGEVVAAGSKWNLDGTNIPAFAMRAKLSIFQRTRRIMNTVMLPFLADHHARLSPSVKSFLGANSAKFVDEEMLKAVFQVEHVLIGSAAVDIGMNPDPLADPVYEDVWGNDVIFAYVDQSPGGARSKRNESFAYTFRYALLNNEAQALAAVQGNDQSMPVTAWYEPDRKSNVRGVEYEEKTHLVSSGCGYVVREVL